MRLALKGADRRLEREQRNLRFIAWHILRPHAGKRFTSLAAFVDPPDAGKRPSDPARRSGGLDLDTTMRKWRAVMVGVESQGTKRPARLSKRSPPP